MLVTEPLFQRDATLRPIPGVDLQPCGGTHVASTSEIGPMAVTRVENKGRHDQRVYVASG